MADAPEQSIQLTLSRAEALVLFEFLARFLQDGRLQVDDAAEEQALANVFCDLKSELVEPLMSNYLEMLEVARSAVRPDPA
jgi:hypothetical protein